MTVAVAVGGSFRRRLQRLHRQTKTTTLVAIENLHPNAIALLDDVLGLLGAAVLEFGDVNQSFRPGHDLNERAECSRALDSAFVRRADLGLGGDRLHHLLGALHRLAANRGNRNQPAVVDADLGASLFLNTTNRLAFGPDQLADLLRIDVDRDDPRCVRR